MTDHHHFYRVDGPSELHEWSGGHVRLWRMLCECGDRQTLGRHVEAPVFTSASIDSATITAGGYVEELHDAERWSRLLGLRIVDPDGWRDTGTPWDTLLTRAAFERLASHSTVAPWRWADDDDDEGELWATCDRCGGNLLGRPNRADCAGNHARAWVEA